VRVFSRLSMTEIADRGTGAIDSERTNIHNVKGIGEG